MPVKLSVEHLLYMNIGQRFWSANIKSLSKDQSDSIKSYLDDFKRQIAKGVGVFLWGANSRGKSYVTAALLKHAWREWRVTGYCITAAALKDAYIDDVEAHPGSAETVTERVRAARILVVDDMGKEHRTSSGFAENRLGMLFRERSRRALVTCITTNLNPKEFGEVYGASTAALAKECMIPIRLTGADLRSSIAKKLSE